MNKGYWNWNQLTYSYCKAVIKVTCKNCFSLTSLVGGNVDRCILWWIRTLVRHPVNGLYFKGVLGVSKEVADVDTGVSQAQLTRNKLDIVSAPGAATPPAAAALTYDVVDHIFSATTLLRWVPLQPQRGLIHYGDDILRSWWNSWRGENHRYCKSTTAFGSLLNTGPFNSSSNMVQNNKKNLNWHFRLGGKPKRLTEMR